MISEHDGVTVSVIVPCFDVEAYVDECIRSIAQQTHTSLQIIVVDDGSTDSTPDLVDQWAADDSRVVVVHQPNAGLGAARNAGVDLAQGAYLCFVDSDDLLPIDAVRRMVVSAEESGADLVSGVADKFTSERQWRAAMYRAPFRTDRRNTHLFYESNLLYDHIACAKLYRRSFWDEHRFRFPEGVLFEDIELVTRAHCLSTSTDLIAETCYLWREREDASHSITQARTAPGSTAARFDSLARVDEFLEREAPVETWDAHALKVLSLDIPVYCRLITENDGTYLAEFIESAGALARRISKRGAGGANPLHQTIWRALIDSDTATLEACGDVLLGRHTDSWLLRVRGARHLGGTGLQPSSEISAATRKSVARLSKAARRASRVAASRVGSLVVKANNRRQIPKAVATDLDDELDSEITRAITTTARLEQRARGIARRFGVLPKPAPRQPARAAGSAPVVGAVGTILGRLGVDRDSGVFLAVSGDRYRIQRCVLLHSNEHIAVELPRTARGFSLLLADLRRFGEQATFRPGTWRVVGIDDTGAAWSVASDYPAAFVQPDPEAGASYNLTGSATAITLSVASLLPVSDRPARAQTAIRSTYVARANSGRTRRAVLYECYYGRSVGCHPRALFEALRHQLPDDVEHVFVCQPGFTHAPPGATTAQRWTRRYHDYLATSPLVIANCELHRTFERSSFQTVLQTWHGTPLKRIGLDIDSPKFRNADYQLDLERQVQQWDAMISPTRDTDEIFRRAFGYSGELLAIGSPRNDRLVRAHPDERVSIRHRLGLGNGDRAILFAPTFRDDAQSTVGYVATPQCDLGTLLRSLPDDTKVLFRAHSNVRSSDIPWNDPRVINVSDYPDAQDLILAGDVLVTDYSSMMFDWALTAKPLVVFAPDLGRYQAVRNFYYDYRETMPVEVAQTPVDLESQLARALSDWSRTLEPLVDQFAHRDDGRATERAVDWILERGIFS